MYMCIYLYETPALASLVSLIRPFRKDAMQSRFYHQHVSRDYFEISCGALSHVEEDHFVHLRAKSLVSLPDAGSSRSPRPWGASEV